MGAVLAGHSEQNRALLRAMKPWTPARASRICDEEGHPATSYAAEKQVIRKPFATHMNGHTCSMASLIDGERASAVIKAIGHQHIKRELGSTPSLIVFDRTHAHTKTRSGTGEDCIGGELHRLLPSTTAIMMPHSMLSWPTVLDVPLFGMVDSSSPYGERKTANLFRKITETLRSLSSTARCLAEPLALASSVH